MKRFAARYFLLIFPSLFASHAFAQAPAPHVEETSSGAATNALPAVPAAQHLFGSIALSTSSEEARKLVELAWDKYENAMYDDAVTQKWYRARPDTTRAIWHGIGIAVVVVGAGLTFLVARTTSYGLVPRLRWWQRSSLWRLWRCCWARDF